MKKLIISILLAIVAGSVYSQDWTPWRPIEDGQQNQVEYSYLITKCKYGNGRNFNMKIRSHYKPKMCGKIKVVLALSDGQTTSLEYDFKNLDATDRMCYGIGQICTTDRFVSVSKVVLAPCDGGKPVNTGVNEIEFKKKPNKN